MHPRLLLPSQSRIQSLLASSKKLEDSGARLLLTPLQMPVFDTGKNTNHSSTHVTWTYLMYSYLIWKNGTKLFSLNCIIRCFQNTHQISLYSKICTIFISLYSQYCPKLILFRKVPDLLGQLPAVSMPETPRRGGGVGGWGGQGGVEGGTPLFGLKGHVPMNYRV